MSNEFVLRETHTVNRVPRLNEFARAETIVNHRTATNLIRTSLGLFLRVGSTAITNPADKVIRIGNAYVGNSGVRPDQFQNGGVLDYTGELWYQPDTKQFLVNKTGSPTGWEAVVPANVVVSNASTGTNRIENMISCTQAVYNTLTPDPKTLYVIV